MEIFWVNKKPTTAREVGDSYGSMMDALGCVASQLVEYDLVIVAWDAPDGECEWIIMPKREARKLAD